MNTTELLKARLAGALKASQGLVALVDADRLDWKPESGENWMTTGQLLAHLQSACGSVAQAFVTENFAPLMVEMDEPPTATDLAAVQAALTADGELTLAMIDQAGETDLLERTTSAPWNPQPRVLAEQIGECIDHLNTHKTQLFYYLKLQGKPVHTGHLWGLDMPT